MLHSASQTKFSVFQVYSSQQELIVMKLVVLTTALLLCAVLQATTVTAAPSDERGKNFSCLYMILYPCSFYLSCFMHIQFRQLSVPIFVLPYLFTYALHLVVMVVDWFRPSVNKVLYLAASTCYFTHVHSTSRVSCIYSSGSSVSRFLSFHTCFPTLCTWL